MLYIVTIIFMSASLDHIRHSLAHLLATAVKESDPEVKLAIGPTIDTGFYYDFELSKPLSEKDFPALEKRMRALIKERLSFERIDATAAQAREEFHDQPYKLELIDELENKGEKITLYQTGAFIDLCRGGHVKNTGEIDPKSFRLDRVAGAYWRGSEKNKMLTRIYGLAFENGAALETFVAQREEAAKRDHRKLGVQLDLFTFSDLVGSGLPLWTPKGTWLRHLLDGFVWELRRARGYERVEIPHITKKELYETSGHWQKFSDELFRMRTRDGHEFAMKPMNCPHHTQIYARRPWSYRDLPQRYANTTMVYRDEQTGELSGLLRVRAITQDDAHVFCRSSQAKDEIAKIWDIVTEFYAKTGGFSLTPRLSLHDPDKREKYLGSRGAWEKAEGMLREIVREKEVSAAEAVGEAAFYGPKIDFLATDSLGRQWQLATIQLDMNLPERFDLFCINENGEKERIVMIHAAIMGSIERYLSVLIEHLGGSFPVWLSPLQVKVLPLGEAHLEYARGVFEALKGADIRAELDDSNETLGKKIRNAKLEKVPYFLVIGDAEVKEEQVTVEGRGGKVGAMALEDFIARVWDEISNRS